MDIIFGRRSQEVSFVDVVSFQCMNDHQLNYVFGFDRDFEQKDFHLLR